MIPTVTIVVFGAGGVGKTSLIRRYMYNSFEESYNPTIEDAFRKVIDHKGALADLNVIDMAGSYQFPAMRRHAIEHGHGFLVVYAVDDPLSVEEAKRLRNEITEVKAGKRVPLLLVCNKIDKLSEEEKEAAKRIQEELLDGTGELTKSGEASAKMNINVGQTFSRILELVAIDCADKENEGQANVPVLRKHSKTRKLSWWRAIKKCLRIR